MRPPDLIDRRPQRLPRPSCVLVLGAGWSAVVGLPLANQLFERSANLGIRDSEVIDTLTLNMNRIRQAFITKEIIEVVSGAAAAEE